MNAAAVAALTGSIGQIVQLAQYAVATARGVVAALKASGVPGSEELPEDDELIRIFGDNSAKGKAEASALVKRIEALIAAMPPAGGQ